MAGHKALGRGLEALFQSNQSKNTGASAAGAEPGPAAAGGSVRDIPIGSIVPNRHQPRTHFDTAALEELAQSIRVHGLAQPLLVTESAPGQYELVVGERRLRASKLAGLASVPCTVKRMTNRERFEVALIENIQRQDLNALEEAVALDGLMREYSLTQEQVAEAIGKSRSSVANTLRLLRLHEDVQLAVREGRISEGHAKCLAGLSDHADQLRVLGRIVAEGLSVRDVEALVSGSKAEKASAPKAARPTSPEIKKYEERFQRLLGRKAEIQSSSGQKGFLRFEFYSPADLDALCERLGLTEPSREDRNPGA